MIIAATHYIGMAVWHGGAGICALGGEIYQLYIIYAANKSRCLVLPGHLMISKMISKSSAGLVWSGVKLTRINTATCEYINKFTIPLCKLAYYTEFQRKCASQYPHGA